MPRADITPPPTVAFVTVIRLRSGEAIIGTLCEDDGPDVDARARESALLSTRSDVVAIEVWRGEFLPYAVHHTRAWAVTAEPDRPA